MIRSRLYLGLILVLGGILAGMIFWSHQSSSRFLTDELPARRQLVSLLSLTDLSLWTEARYTRHPAMADLFSPFQDHPVALEHFPAGSLMAPAMSRPDTVLQVRRQGEP